MNVTIDRPAIVDRLLAHPDVAAASVVDGADGPVAVVRPHVFASAPDLREVACGRTGDRAGTDRGGDRDDVGLLLVDVEPGTLSALGADTAEGVSRYVAPVGEVEGRLTALAQERLDVGPIGVEDDLLDWGCDSFEGVALLTEVADRYGVELDMAELFELATIRGLAGRVAGGAGAGAR